MLYLTAYFPITSPTLIFFVVLIIILFAPIIMGKLRIPHIIGMVLAGMVIGQNGLDILTRDSSFELFGKVGLLYIMFLAGLEMDLESVKKNSRRFLIFGLLTCLIPLILTYTMSRWLLDYSHTASFLLGCIMASNTLIAYPIISRYGLQRNSSVMLSVGSSMLSLFLALMMLAALSAAYDEDTGFVFWIMFLIKFAAFLALLGWSIPKLARYFLRRYSDAVMQYIFVLSVMFLSAALSEAIGVEGIVGAFLAGLILNRYIPHVSPLMNRIEFIGNALFIPYFLIGVGMLINVHSLFEGFHMLWIVTLIAFFGTFGKALAAYLSSLLFRLPKAAGNMMFGLTCAHAAGAIAMVMVGMNLEVSPGVYLVNNEMLNGVVIMILITCIISTMVTDHASQQIILANRQENTGSQTPNADDEKIMLCVKYPEIAPQLLELAIMMRNEKLNRGLVALNVVYDDALSSKHQEQGQQLLERLQQRAAASDIQMQTQVRLASNIANGIKHAFREFGASEIIMGMHVHTDVNPKFWGEFIQSLYNGLNRQIVLTRFVQPLNTLRRIQVAVPSRAEFEPGFHRWLERLSRMASNLDCRIQFHGRNESMELIREYINNHHPSVRAEYTYMAHWNELPKLAANISDDHMFVVITARKGTISYKSALERLPNELRQHFSGKNLMILFPDQYGDAKEESMTFTAAQHQEESSVYDTISRWINHHRTKKHNSH
ncbi:MAG: cation:proton antiporter [Prevotella sp.]|jgi:Kef-type K+ transport system membrane component KefB|nr:cation:proton antiporter [Prevotella sp.]MBQ5496588.1 cation:proton antiporter [Prevotella sp.]